MDKIFLYSRQFIITDSSEPFYDFWNLNTFLNLKIYTHPLLNTNYVKKENAELFLIGYIFNPYTRERDEKKLLFNIIETGKDFKDISKAISDLSGRFVLLLSYKETVYIFNDAGGLRSVYFTKNNNKIFIGSQPGIFSKFFELVKTENYSEFVNSAYYKNNADFSLPGGVTLYENVQHLVPNHYLNLATFEQQRFWPIKSIKPDRLDNCVSEISELFGNLLYAANKKFKLSLPLTAGYDSRTILSFCKPFISDTYVYTLKYRDLDVSSNDLRLPKLITGSLNICHHIIDCHLEMDQKFLDYYSTSADLYHDDWAKIAYGLFLHYPKDRVVLKGACSEIVKCWYQNRINRKNIYSGSNLCRLEPGWDKFKFVSETLDKWLEDAKQICLDSNINILDLFVWEHRIGTWQANCQLEWDIAQEVYSPFNTRPILELMLSIDPKYRQNEKPIFLKKIIENSWKELNNFPANPIKPSTIVKNRIQSFLTKRNLYSR